MELKEAWEVRAAKGRREVTTIAMVPATQMQETAEKAVMAELADKAEALRT
ncbi:MAG: hypothetical protein LC754_09940 [Acidobacteria bacterium]|nr:hypothetical protein [Acidobacteriota bacterium]